MNVGEGIRVALASLGAYKLRTFLTVLGNIVAVTSVIAVVSLIDGADRYVRREVANEGSNVLTLRRLDEFKALTDMDAFLASLHNPNVTLSDYRAMRAADLPGVERIGAHDRAFGKVEWEGRSLGDVEIDGWTADYPFFLDRGRSTSRDRALAAGRHFTTFEDEHSSPVCVIGSDVARRILKSDAPIGRTILVNGRHLEVVGVLEERPAVLGQDQNKVVMMPLGRYLKMFGGTESIAIGFLVSEISNLQDVTEEIRVQMRIRHALRPSKGDDFAVTSSERIVALWQSISHAIFTALIMLVAISLVIGGVVIMNVMMVSVNERTREIGLRKAIGAKRADILGQFLAESVAISMSGGLLGILLGFLLAVVVSWLSPLPYAVEPWSIVAGLGTTFAVGFFFGIYPASRAASLDPVEALRRE